MPGGLHPPLDLLEYLRRPGPVKWLRSDQTASAEVPTKHRTKMISENRKKFPRHETTDFRIDP
jgi:hypothetical protein